MERVKLAVVLTHPVQYYTPIFRALARSSDLNPRVFYTWSQSAHGQVYDPGFGTRFAWDIPLLDGYEHVFVENVAQRPGSSRFGGIDNPTLAREITEWGASAVLIYGWNRRSHLHVMRHFKGRIPVLFRGDSTLLDPTTTMRSIARRLWLRWVYQHIDVALAVGQNNRDYYLWCGVGAERIVCVPHSVDTERFRDAGGEHEAGARQRRRQLGIPDDATVFLFAGKFIPKKHPLLLLEAFDKLNSAAHLVLVGNGEQEAQLRERAAAIPNVHFLSFQNQSSMPGVYRIGDVYVLPSIGPGETWGLAMNEAMASERAVIASSRTGGARDLVQPGVTGWQFRAGQVEDLLGVMRQALALGRQDLLGLGTQAARTSHAWSSEAAADATARAVRTACSPSKQ
jgi:glycosyltransferase involved in cell wall biosynthesis